MSMIHMRRRYSLLFLPLLVICLLVMPASVCLAEGTGVPAAETSGSQAVAASLAAGYQHSAMINYDGQLYLWGDNKYGQLGISGQDYCDTPQWLELSDKAIAVSLGAYHTLVLLADGSVWSFGRNAFGQLGTGDTVSTSVPTLVRGLPKIIAISAGAWHSLALGEDGSVWAWGNNTNFQIGNVGSETITGTDGKVLGTRCISPVQIVSDGAAAIAAGGLFSMYLGRSGFVFAWGDNSKGQLGNGSIQQQGSPAQVLGISGAAAIAAGYQHCLAVCRFEDHDELMAWGDDSLGQLGSGSGLTADAFRSLPTRIDANGDDTVANDHIHNIYAGYTQSAATVPAIDSKGNVSSVRQQLLVWGSNSNGQLALGNAISQNHPAAVSGTFNNWSGSDFLPFDDIALGGGHMLVLSSKGLLAAVGRGDYGQLGNMSVIDRDRLISVEIPDVIRPIWLEGCRISAVWSQDGQLVVRWPAAQDNRVVDNYRIKLATPDGTVETIDADDQLSWTFKGLSEEKAYKITVMACDSNSINAEESTLSRLFGYALPKNAAAGATAADFFKNIEKSVPQIKYLSTNWQPDAKNLLRPLEVPWDTSAIYGVEAIARPANWQWFGYAAIVAALLTLLMLIDVWFHRTFKRKLVPCDT